jgi:glycosyltransferase involved in cell wall biosynthesis
VICTRYTVLICTRNRADTLARALTSHLSIEVPKGVTRDLVVVDNGSIDRTAEAVEAFRKTAPFAVQYLREEREGHSIALNTGCRAATGDAIIFTDDDALPEQGWLMAIHDTFSRRDADWVYGPVYPEWENNRTPWWYGPYTRALVACLDYGPDEFVATEQAQSFFGVNHACRRDRLFTLGLYREDYGILPGRKGFTGNDEDLFTRAVKAGYRIVYQPQARVHHLIPAARSRAAYHREIAVVVAQNLFDQLRASPPLGPSFLGLPRYYYAMPIELAIGWLRGLVAGDGSVRFFNELRLLRFLTMIGCAVRYRLIPVRAVGPGSRT